MKLLLDKRRLRKNEIWQEGDWFKVDRGVYVELTYRNTPIAGALLGNKVGNEIGWRSKFK